MERGNDWCRTRLKHMLREVLTLETIDARPYADACGERSLRRLSCYSRMREASPWSFEVSVSMAQKHVMSQKQQNLRGLTALLVGCTAGCAAHIDTANHQHSTRLGDRWILNDDESHTCKILPYKTVPRHCRVASLTCIRS